MRGSGKLHLISLFWVIIGTKSSVPTSIFFSPKANAPNRASVLCAGCHTKSFVKDLSTNLCGLREGDPIVPYRVPCEWVSLFLDSNSPGPQDGACSAADLLQCDSVHPNLPEGVSEPRMPSVLSTTFDGTSRGQGQHRTLHYSWTFHDTGKLPTGWAQAAFLLQPFPKVSHDSRVGQLSYFLRSYSLTLTK